MKRFLLLTFITLSAQAACDYEIRDRMFRTPDQIREFKCDLNFTCVEATIRNPNSSLEEIDALVEFSRDNRCNDELKLTELFARLMAEGEPDEEIDGEENEVSQNTSDRGINTKADLPVIPDAPAESGARVQRQ
ncbi:MAG: hypothetical protein V4598_01400 [Bdellovibrionota bacterium]